MRRHSLFFIHATLEKQAIVFLNEEVPHEDLQIERYDGVMEITFLTDYLISDEDAQLVMDGTGCDCSGHFNLPADQPLFAGWSAKEGTLWT